MGRYYSGDIEGKFWFGIQGSDDAEQFGAVDSEPGYINYYTDDLDACKERLDEITKSVGLDIDYSTFDAETVHKLVPKDAPFAVVGEYASLELGLKIYQCIEKNGFCVFEAEI